MANDGTSVAMTNGAAAIPGSGIVELAQAVDAPNPGAVGFVLSAQGIAVVVRADGTREVLAAGSRILPGDLVETSGLGGLAVEFEDGTGLSLGPDSRVAVNEYQFSAATGDGRATFAVSAGSVVVSAGAIGRGDSQSLRVETPLGMVGVRNAQVGLDLGQGRTLNVGLIDGIGGRSGEFVVVNGTGATQVGVEGQMMFIGAFDRQPVFAGILPETQIGSRFAAALQQLPTGGVGGGQEFGFRADLAIQTASGATGGPSGGGPSFRVVGADYTGPGGGLGGPGGPVGGPGAVPGAFGGPSGGPGVGGSGVDGLGGRDDVVPPSPPSSPPVNDAPVAGRPSFTMNEDGTLTISEAQLLAGSTDPENSTLRIANLAMVGGSGTLADNDNGTWTYVPAANWNGELQLSYVVSDGVNQTVTTATIAVNPINDAPTVGTPSFTMNEDGTLTITRAQLLAGSADVDGDALSVANLGVVGGSGTLTDNGNDTWSYAPPADWNGNLQLAYNVTDGRVDVATTAALTVNAVADAPVLNVANTSGNEDTVIALSVAADVPGAENLVSVVISGVPTGATLSLGVNGGGGNWTISGAQLVQLATLTMTPPADFSGEMTLGVLATSTDGGQSSSSLTVTAQPVADAPTLTTANVSINTGGATGTQTLTGGNGVDTLIGGAGADVLYGNDGNDILYGDGTEYGGPTTVALSIASALRDLDGSESLALTIAGVPAGATLSAGTALGGGQWSLTPEQLAGLTITLPVDYRSNFTLTVTATATDSWNGTTSTATTSRTIGVSYAGSTPGNDTIWGGSGDDTIYAGPGTNLAYGETGNDLMRGGSGVDTFEGGDDNDTLYGLAGNDTLRGGPGTDTIWGGANDDTVEGGIDNDTLYGDDGNDTLRGEAGADLMQGGAGTDRMYGGTESDTLYGDAGTDTLWGDDGTDTLFGGTENDVLWGGNQDDYLDGGDGSDTVRGEAGNDTLRGGGGTDLIYGGTESDTLYGDAGTDTLWGDDGTDTLFGGTENDVLWGGNNDDYLDGEAGNDTLRGEAGNDTLRGGDGADIVYGGLDQDVVHGDAGTDTLYGDDGNDTLFGGTENDVLYGGNQDDVLDGGAGIDIVRGDAGNDIVRGGADNDSVYGGTGNDTLYGDDGDDSLWGEDGLDILYGGGGADRLSGGNQVDTLYGQAGADSLYGDADNDVLYGGDLNDLLDGGTGNDILFGDVGDDVFRPGAGNDTMTGGAGVDSFIINRNQGTDRVTDFAPGDFLRFEGSTSFNASSIRIQNNVNGDAVVTFTGTTTSVTLEGVSSSELGYTIEPGTNAVVVTASET